MEAKLKGIYKQFTKHHDAETCIKYLTLFKEFHASPDEEEMMNDWIEGFRQLLKAADPSVDAA